MTVIHGNFKYNTYYYSIDEMVKDKELRLGYCVKVIENGIGTEYQITDKNEGIKLGNGLYATKSKSGNEPEDKGNIMINEENRYNVGGFREGEILGEVSVQKFAEKLLIEGNEVSFRIELDNKVIEKGESNNVGRLWITIDSTFLQVKKVSIYISGEKVLEKEVSWLEGKYDIDIVKNVSYDAEITVILTDEEGNTFSRDSSINARYSVYYGIISSNLEPTGAFIKTLNKNYKDDIISYNGTYQNNKFIVAVPDIDSKIENIRDENGWKLNRSFDVFSLYLTIGGVQVPYKVYRSKAISVSSFTFEVEIGGIDESN